LPKLAKIFSFRLDTSFYEEKYFNRNWKMPGIVCVEGTNLLTIIEEPTMLNGGARKLSGEIWCIGLLRDGTKVIRA
jgi:hypothetical protein